ncbi:MAG: hypothetical protein AAGF93_17045 [Cyanobacteria bacterium P01_H01_bin.105]
MAIKDDQRLEQNRQSQKDSGFYATGVRKELMRLQMLVSAGILPLGLSVAAYGETIDGEQPLVAHW